jgi:60 kDa chaperonin 1|nr:MAG TPA: GroEL [Caudoviricetes sp.]
MPKLNLVRNVVSGNELQGSIQKGIDTIYSVALAAYGANSGNVMIEHRYGEPVLSHDGITNVDNLVVENPVENSAISVVRQASEKTNRAAGDATTLTILLTKIAYDHWNSQGLSPRETQRQMAETVKTVVDKIQKEKLACSDQLLRQVSKISAGDTAIGELVADAVAEVGKNGSVTVVESTDSIVSSSIINGFSFKKGIRVPALADNLNTLKTQFENPAVIVMPKLISKNEEILPILDRCLQAERRPIVLIADVSGQALDSIVANKLNGALNIAVIEPLAAGRDAFLSDIAAYASTKQFAGQPSEFNPAEHIGTVESVSVSLTETTLTGCINPEALASYVSSIDDTERRERLQGKTARISVGAPTQAERQETKLRIEDAVCAAKTAYEHGVLPGGGVFLRNTDIDYLKTPFELLTGKDAADLNGTMGVDIETNETVDVIEHGIVDSAKAIEEAVVNSHSVAAQLIAVKVALPFAKDAE